MRFSYQKKRGLTIKRFILIFVVSLFILKGTIGSSDEYIETGDTEPVKLPFAVGEEIAYTVSWEMIPAGKAWFRVLDHTTIDGQKAWHFVLEARSKRFIDFFHKIRDRYESYTNEAFTRSFLYKKTQTGKADKQVVVEFDWEKKMATYSNFGGKRAPIAIPENALDPLSSYYKLRTLNFKEKDVKNGEALFFSVTDGKKSFVQKGEIIKQEKLVLSSGTYDTYLVIPQVTHFSGVFKKSDNPTVKVWISADERQVPIRIKVKVSIGSIIFDLVSIR